MKDNEIERDGKNEMEQVKWRERNRKEEMKWRQ